MNVLLIEDDLRLVSHLTEMFKSQGILVDHIDSYENLVSGISSFSDVDAVILDRLLGMFDTKNVVSMIRNQFPLATIIVLSAINTPIERTELINLGADDYMGKPFATHELVARLKASARRNSSQISYFVTIGNLVIDTLNRTISVDGQSSSLPAKEFSILRTLSQPLGKVWSKGELLDYIWGQNALVETNVVEATVTNLRKKLSSLNAKVSIKNMRNAGYWIEE